MTPCLFPVTTGATLDDAALCGAPAEWKVTSQGVVTYLCAAHFERWRTNLAHHAPARLHVTVAVALTLDPLSDHAP